MARGRYVNIAAIESGGVMVPDPTDMVIHKGPYIWDPVKAPNFCNWNPSCEMSMVEAEALGLGYTYPEPPE